MAKLNKSLRLCFKTKLKGNVLSMEPKKPVLFFMIIYLIITFVKERWNKK